MTERDRLHLGAVAPEQERAILVVAQLPAQLGDLGDQPRLLDRALDRGVERDLAEPFGIVGLDDVVGGAEAHRLDDRRRLLAARQHDDLQLGLRRLQRAQRLEAVHARHHHVEQHDVGRIALLDGGEHLVAARVGARLVAAQREEGPQVVRRTRNRRPRWRRRVSSTLQLRQGKRDDGRSARDADRGCPDRRCVLAGDQMRPPCPSMTRRASGSARPRPPRFSSNGAGSRSYAACTLLSSATTTTASWPPSRSRAGARRPRSHGPGFSRRIARKIASNAVRSRVASPVMRAPSDGPRSFECTSRSSASCTSSATSATSENSSTGCRAQRDDAAVELADRRSARRSSATSRAHDFSASSIILRCRSLSGGSCRAAASAGSRRRRWPACGTRERRARSAADRDCQMSPRDQLIIRALHYFVKTIPAIAWLRSENVPKHAHRSLAHRLKYVLPHEEAVSGSVPGGARRSSRRASRIRTLARFSSGDHADHALGVASPAVLPSWSLPDGVESDFVGTVLFGLAAAVRKIPDELGFEGGIGRVPNRYP